MEHPGKHLDAFMAIARLSARELGEALHVPGNRISDIVRGRRNITADTALRLERYFGEPTAMWWMQEQAQYDLRVAQQKALDKDQEA